MSNIGTVLREEISRLSRKEIRSQVDPTKKSTAKHGRDIAALKRQMTQLIRQVTLLSRKVLSAHRDASPDSTARSMRFSAKGLHVWRQLLFPVTTIKTAAHYTVAGSAMVRVLDFAPATLAR